MYSLYKGVLGQRPLNRGGHRRAPAGRRGSRQDHAHGPICMYYIVLN